MCTLKKVVSGVVVLFAIVSIVPMVALAHGVESTSVKSNNTKSAQTEVLPVITNTDSSNFAITHDGNNMENGQGIFGMGMGFGTSGAYIGMGILSIVLHITWLLVGILLIIWLWKKVSKK